jgi:hypothetical protein
MLVGAQAFPVKSEDPAPTRTILLRGRADLHDGESDRGIGDISDGIDVPDLKPSTHDGRPDIRLVLVVRR